MLKKATFLLCIIINTTGYAKNYLKLQNRAERMEKNYNINDLFKAYLDVSSFRHKVLSENLANVNTPSYKANEVDMPEEYKDLVKGNNRRHIRLNITSEKHLKGKNHGSSKFRSHKLKDPYEIKMNGNNISLPQQMTKLSQNQQDYNAAVKTYSATNGLISATLGK